MADIADLYPEKEYSEEKGILLWKPHPNMMRIVLKAGSYVILFTQDAQGGCIVVNGKVRDKKIVGKVSLDIKVCK